MNDYESVTIDSRFGRIDARLFAAPETPPKAAAIWVGGVGGNWDSPARSLYPHLGKALTSDGITSLWVNYRHPGVLGESVLDVLAATVVAESLGVAAIALVGWSFGGAVVIAAAASSPLVRAVATISTQSYGAAEAVSLIENCAILLLHGAADNVLPVSCSKQVHALAREPKQLIVLPGAGHALDEAADRVHELVADWVKKTLLG